MTDRLPWSRGASLAALTLVLATWALGLMLMTLGHSLGWLLSGLAAWFTVGMVYSVLHTPGSPG